jgi:hypothetical protein
VKVTSLSRSAEAGAEPTADPRPADPYQNPSYPVRTHFDEAAKLQDALHAIDERINSAFQKLSALANHGQKPVFVRLYHQMQGARDQVAEAARRMPLETGDLYREDKERFEQAIAAFERIRERWEKTGG